MTGSPSATIASDRHRVQAVEETAGAIDGVDHPQHSRVGQAGAALFAEKTILRKRALNALFDKGLHPLIGHADHILQVVALMVDGQRLALLIVFKRQLSPAFASSQARR